MAKRSIDKDISSMSAEAILRATGNAPAPDNAEVEFDPPTPDEIEVIGAMSADAEQDRGPTLPPPPAVPTDDRAMAMLDRIERALTSLATIAANGGGGGTNNVAIERLTSALERMTEAQVDGSQKALEESRRAFRPSNSIVPNVSVFDRRGTKLGDYSKPKLKCLMMIPWLVEWESCTREEVELLNLLEPGEYTIKRADRSKITMVVQIDYKADRVTPSVLKILHDSAYSNGNARNMPPLADMLRDMLKQHDRPVSQAATAVLTDEEEEALIEAGELSVSK